MPDNPKTTTVKRRPLHAHLVKHGPMTRENPELVRIAKESSYSADHVYKIAIGQRAAQPRAAKAIAAAVGVSSVTERSLMKSARLAS